MKYAFLRFINHCMLFLHQSMDTSYVQIYWADNAPVFLPSDSLFSIVVANQVASISEHTSLYQPVAHFHSDRPRNRYLYFYHSIPLRAHRFDEPDGRCVLHRHVWYRNDNRCLQNLLPDDNGEEPLRRNSCHSVLLNNELPGGVPPDSFDRNCLFHTFMPCRH